jgi:hypothetical protein
VPTFPSLPSLCSVFGSLANDGLFIVELDFTQTTTRAVRGLPEAVQAAGFTIESARRSKLGNFVELVAVKPR